MEIGIASWRKNLTRLLSQNGNRSRFLAQKFDAAVVANENRNRCGGLGLIASPKETAILCRVINSKSGRKGNRHAA